MIAAKRLGSWRAGPLVPTWPRCWKPQSTARRQAQRAASARRPRWHSSTATWRCQAACQTSRRALDVGCGHLAESSVYVACSGTARCEGLQCWPTGLCTAGVVLSSYSGAQGHKDQPALQQRRR